MDNPTSIVGLELEWRPLAGDERRRAQIKLDKAWRALRLEIPTLAARVDAGEVSEDDVADVIYSATLRILQNPEGLKSFQRSIDDASEGGDFGATSSNDLYFTSAELRRLSPRAATSAFTIRTRPSCSPWG